MKLKTKKSKFAIKNYFIPTPVKWRKIGDTILLGCTSLAAIMMTAPFPDKTISWTVFIVNLIGVTGKVISNMFTDNLNIENGTNNSSQDSEATPKD